MRKLLLHIGIGKTGSSAIQYAFSLASETLAAHGIAYPERAKVRSRVLSGIPTGGNAGHINSCLHRKREMSFVDAIMSMMARSKTTLLSHETLYSADEADLREMRDKLADANIETSVLLFFRPQVDFLPSAYLQRLKKSAALGSLDEDALKLISLQSYNNWLTIAERWALAFGIKRIKVCWYPAIVRGDGVIAEAFRWLGVPAPDVNTPIINPTPGREAAFIIGQVNKAGYGGRQFADRFLLSAQEAGLLGTRLTLSEQTARKIESMTMKDNTELLRRFCPHLDPAQELTPTEIRAGPPLNQETVAALRVLALHALADTGVSDAQALRALSPDQAHS